jgi:hypothetical protein
MYLQHLNLFHHHVSLRLLQETLLFNSGHCQSSAIPQAGTPPVSSSSSSSNHERKAALLFSLPSSLGTAVIFRNTANSIRGRNSSTACHSCLESGEFSTTVSLSSRVSLGRSIVRTVTCRSHPYGWPDRQISLPSLFVPTLTDCLCSLCNLHCIYLALSLVESCSLVHCS